MHDAEREDILRTRYCGELVEQSHLEQYALLVRYTKRCQRNGSGTRTTSVGTLGVCEVNWRTTWGDLSSRMSCGAHHSRMAAVSVAFDHAVLETGRIHHEAVADFILGVLTAGEKAAFHEHFEKAQSSTTSSVICSWVAWERGRGVGSLYGRGSICMAVRRAPCRLRRMQETSSEESLATQCNLTVATVRPIGRASEQRSE